MLTRPRYLQLHTSVGISGRASAHQAGMQPRRGLAYSTVYERVKASATWILLQKVAAQGTRQVIENRRVKHTEVLMSVFAREREGLARERVDQEREQAHDIRWEVLEGHVY